TRLLRGPSSPPSPSRLRARWARIRSIRCETRAGRWTHKGKMISRAWSRRRWCRLGKRTRSSLRTGRGSCEPATPSPAAATSFSATPGGATRSRLKAHAHPSRRRRRLKKIKKRTKGNKSSMDNTKSNKKSEKKSEKAHPHPRRRRRRRLKNHPRRRRPRLKKIKKRTKGNENNMDNTKSNKSEKKSEKAHPHHPRRRRRRRRRLKKNTK
ncbi:unnamed protein product, partial [Ectocarpus sp. 8 AP-2014]